MHIHETAPVNLYAAEFMQYAFHFAAADTLIFQPGKHAASNNALDQPAGLCIRSKSGILLPACNGQCAKEPGCAAA